MNNIRGVEQINELELKQGIHGGMPGSWHHRYKDSAWVYLGGLPYELTEGDIICFMSQWGEIEDINLCRDEATNKSLGFCFVKYENQRSTILAVDNFNGMKLIGRIIRCDHVDRYKLPKHIREKEEEKITNDPNSLIDIGPGHAYKEKELANNFNIESGVNLWDNDVSKKIAVNTIAGYKLIEGDDIRDDSSDSTESKGKHKKHKKDDKKHKKHKKDDRKDSKKDSKKRDRDHYDELPKSTSKAEMNPLEIAKLLSNKTVVQPTSSGGAAVMSWRGNRELQ